MKTYCNEQANYSQNSETQNDRKQKQLLINQVHPSIPNYQKYNFFLFVLFNELKHILAIVWADFIQEVGSNLHHQQTFIKQLKTKNQISNVGQFKNQLPNSSLSGKQPFQTQNSTRQRFQSNYLDLTKRRGGRGGNCILANQSKNLYKIILKTLEPNAESTKLFLNYFQAYSINTQRQSLIIQLLILHAMAKKAKISSEIYEQIIQSLLSSIKTSSKKCSIKLSQELERKQFHTKNLQLLNKVNQIIVYLYDISKQNLNQRQNFKLQQLEALISQTYKSKEKDWQRALIKIKSVVLNHPELQQMFGIFNLEVQQELLKTILYIYWKSISQRRKRINQKAQKILKKFKQLSLIEQIYDQFLVSYMVLNIMKVKKKQIWSQLIKNLTAKCQYHKGQEEIKNLCNLLEVQIPQRVETIMLEFQRKTDLSKEGSNKIWQEQLIPNQQQRGHQNQPQINIQLIEVYKEMLDSCQF